MTTARVKIYGHPGLHGWGRAEQEPHQGPPFPHPGDLVSEFKTSIGGMHTRGSVGDDGEYTQEPKGVCFFVAPINYEGLGGREMPRSRYDHLIFFHEFDWKTREGKYFHIPYGGSIDISAEE